MTFEFMTTGRERLTNGRYARSRNPITLYPIVQAVAEEAARRDHDPLKDPRTVTQRAWNAARSSLEAAHGHIPQANEVQRQLRDFSGKPFPWQDLLAAVFDNPDVRQTHEKRLREPARQLDERDIAYALRYIATRLNRPTLLPHEYAEARETLITESPTASEADACALRLPSRWQIEIAAGSWDGALAAAGLEPRQPQPTPLASGGPPHQSISPAKIDPPPGEEKPIPPSRARPGRPRTYTHHDVIEAVQHFVRTLPPNTPATDKRWRAFSRGQGTIPSLNVIKAHGGLQALLREASRRDWNQRATEWESQYLTTRTTGQRPRKPRRRQPTRHGTNQRIELVRRIGEQSPATARELADALGVTRTRVAHMVAELRPLGLIKPTNPNPRSPTQSYTLTPRAKKAVRDETTLRRLLTGTVAHDH